MGIIFLWWVFISVPCIHEPLSTILGDERNGGQEWNAGKGETLPCTGCMRLLAFWVYHASVRGCPVVTAFCCLSRVALGLCVYAVLSLRLSFVMSPLFWCLSVVTGGHASSDWSPGPVLVGVRLGACMRREWVVSGLCF